MKTIELDVAIEHKDLVEIFFKVNGLFDLGFKLDITHDTYILPNHIMTNKPGETHRQHESTHPRKSMVCLYNEDIKEQADKILFMNVNHKGISNMLHNFLNKCGIHPRHYKLK